MLGTLYILGKVSMEGQEDKVSYSLNKSPPTVQELGSGQPFLCQLSSSLCSSLSQLLEPSALPRDPVFSLDQLLDYSTDIVKTKVPVRTNY